MNKEEQKQLITDIMNEDAKDGLYVREYNGSRLGEVGDLKAQSLKLITNFNK